MYRSRRSTKPLSECAGEEKSETQWLEDSLSHVKELSDRVTELSTLMGVSTLLSSDRPLPEVLEAVARLGAEICKAQVAFIHLVDGEEDLVCIARHSPSDPMQYTWEGIARIYGRKAIQQAEPVSCPDVLLRRSGETPDSGLGQLGGISALPLKGKTRVVGAMTFGYSNSHRFSARERDMMSAITAQVTMAVERSWLLDQLQEQLARESSLREVATHIGSKLELEVVMDAIVNHASRLLAAEFSAIFLAEDPTGQKPQVEGVGGERGRIHGDAVQLGDSPLGNAVHRAMETARPALVQAPFSHFPAEPPSEPKPNDYRVALAVPLLSGNEALGALVICYLEKRHFDASDISLAEAFATQAALAIRNARVYEEAMESRLSLESALNQISNHGIILLDDELNIRFANPASFWLLGVAPKRCEMPRDEWTALLKRGLADGGELDRAVEQILANPEDTVSADLKARVPADSPRSVRLLSLPLRQPDGTLRGRVNLIEEK